MPPFITTHWNNEIYTSAAIFIESVDSELFADSVLKYWRGLRQGVRSHAREIGHSTYPNFIFNPEQPTGTVGLPLPFQIHLLRHITQS